MALANKKKKIEKQGGTVDRYLKTPHALLRSIPALVKT